MRSQQEGLRVKVWTAVYLEANLWTFEGLTDFCHLLQLLNSKTDIYQLIDTNYPLTAVGMGKTLQQKKILIETCKNTTCKR